MQINTCTEVSSEAIRSKIWPKRSSTSLLNVCKQQRLVARPFAACTKRPKYRYLALLAGCTYTFLTLCPLGNFSCFFLTSADIFQNHLFRKILRSFSSLPLIHSRRVVVSYKQKYVHELLVNRLFKPAQEKVWLAELTVPQ